MASTIRPRASEHVAAWDVASDVVIVGFGASGASAAIEALRCGADVTVLEAAGGWGGASAMAGGLIYLGGGTAIQQACGFEDSPAEMFRFLTAACGPEADEAKLALYCEQSPEHFDWLVSCGVPFKASFWDRLTMEPWSDDGLMFCGGERAHPFDEVAQPAPRGHCPTMKDKVRRSRGGGWRLMQALARTATDLGVDILTDTRAERLVVEGDGCVRGVVARRYGDDITVRARRGVVLAAGSFTFDDRLLADHAPLLLGTGKVGVDQHDGRALRMAQAVGAATKHMEAGEATIGVPPALMVPGIVVNGRGQRFVNEDTYAGRIGQKAVYEQGKEVFVVIDAEIYEGASQLCDGVQPTWVCETLAELEAEMRVPTGSLEATVEYYNQHARRGEDPLFQKKAKWLKPLRSPFGAIDTAGRFRTFTLGGLKTTVDGEVLDAGGDPIRGLFAAGRTASGVPAWGYISGTSLGDCTFFGRRAGLASGRNVLA